MWFFWWREGGGGEGVVDFQGMRQCIGKEQKTELIILEHTIIKVTLLFVCCIVVNTVKMSENKLNYITGKYIK